MKEQLLVLLAISFIWISACKNSNQADPDYEVQILRQTTDSLLKALNLKDANLLVKYYDANALFISPESGLHYGKDDIKKSYEAGFALPGFYINGSIQDVQVAGSGDLGYTLVPCDSYFIPESCEKIERKGLNLLVWKKQENGTWRVVIDKP